MWYGDTEGDMTVDSDITGRVASRLKNEGKREETAIYSCTGSTAIYASQNVLGE